MQDRDQIISAAHAMADAARAAILPLFRRSIGVDNKADAGFDPVTEADRAAETAMRAVLARLRPDDAILGEEFGSQPGTTGLQWVLDPIDGTRAFICGAASWGVLIALCDDSGPIYGLIDQPHIGERFEGGLGLARLVGPSGELALRVRPPRPLAQAILMTTFPEIGTESEAKRFRNLSERTVLTRYGMDCYAYGLLALGQIDLVVEAGLQPYDIAAPMAVVQAAGGIVTDWQGGTARHGGQVIAASCPEIHAEALSLLNR